jgi:hypothetical protein
MVRRISRIHDFEIVFPRHAEATSHLLTQLRMCDLIVADLSLERPSVYFELGLAAAVGVRTVVFAVRDTLIHQIPAELTVEYYDDIADYERQLGNHLARHE